MNNIFSETYCIKRNAEKDTDGQPVFSSMDPPDAYKSPGDITVLYEKLFLFLRLPCVENKIILAELKRFKRTQSEVRKEGINKERNNKPGEFFGQDILPLIKLCVDVKEGALGG